MANANVFADTVRGAIAAAEVQPSVVLVDAESISDIDSVRGEHIYPTVRAAVAAFEARSTADTQPADEGDDQDVVDDGGSGA